MTIELKADIARNAAELFAARAQAVWDDKPDVGDIIVERLHAPYKDAMQALPKEMFEQVASFDLMSVAGHNLERLRLKLQAPVCTVERHFTFPCGSTTDGSSIPDIKLSNDPMWADIAAAMNSYMAARSAVVRERNEFVNGVKALMDRHATLAPALKEWPPLWDLVPETFKIRHRAVVERAKPAAKQDTRQAAVDLSKLTATIVTSKITK
jgi:hypothetical protein